ncbi:hypothetical protein BpHYR1_014248 [Brachionus plicatilis]|uniref:Uncharacterized protein n=1 Tax=Brachionus plicatilis TaxID=10195 RepID=A0A3M7SC65_BRAPC|nr:hypothetical protein BpHYR1_014248 [Brachionus plicatilis]
MIFLKSKHVACFILKFDLKFLEFSKLTVQNKFKEGNKFVRKEQNKMIKNLKNQFSKKIFETKNFIILVIP